VIGHSASTSILSDKEAVGVILAVTAPPSRFDEKLRRAKASVPNQHAAASSARLLVPSSLLIHQADSKHCTEYPDNSVQICQTRSQLIRTTTAYEGPCTYCCYLCPMPRLQEIQSMSTFRRGERWTSSLTLVGN